MRDAYARTRASPALNQTLSLSLSHDHHHHHAWRYLHCYMRQGQHFALISYAGLKWVEMYIEVPYSKSVPGLPTVETVRF